MDDGYETSAPQWTDFSEITPNRYVEGDEYFDRIHENLEVFSNINSQKYHRNELREKVNLKESDISSILLDTSKNINTNTLDIESTFMNDIDKIHMTPIKITSPRTKNKEPMVMEELSVNEVLTNAIRGLEIASSKSRNCHKSQILNATVCSSSTTNSKVTPAQRKIRISRSMYHYNSKLLNGKTPAAKAAATPRPVNISNVEMSMDESEKNSIVSINVDNEKRYNDNSDSSLVCGNSSIMKIKTPIKLSKSTDKTSHIIKTPKFKWPIEKLNKNVNTEKIIVENIYQADTITQNEVDNAEVEQDIKAPMKFHDLNNASDDKIDDNAKNNEKLKDHLNIDDTFNVDFEVRHTNNIEQRNCRNGQVTLLTNPARRRSSIGIRRRRSNKYISLAEAVSTFQRSTPTRFHTVSSKSGPIQRIKQQTTAKCTIPISPALKSKTRLRNHAVLSQAEREELEIKNMRKHQIHANPLRPGILAAPETLKTVAKKPTTIPKPFKLSEGKSTSTLPPKASNHQSIARPKRIMTLAPSDDSQSLENQEILNFGIPVVKDFNEARHDSKNKTTRPQPFSLAERHKQFLNKKEEKLKLLQSEEAKKLKFEFHARPVPAAVKKNSTVELVKDKLQKATVPHVQLVPFSFEGRDKIIAKKKDELRKKLEEEERKARIFHANPAPIFKPVTIRSVSRENLKLDIKTKSAENLKIDGKIHNNNVGHMMRGKSADSLNKPNTKINLRNQSTENLKIMKRINSNGNVKANLNNSKSQKKSTEQINDEENITPNIPITKQINPSNMPLLKPKLKSLPIELHSDKRAKMRRKYDEKVKLKLEQDAERRRKEQERRLACEQAEIAEIRKKAEIKARPMPIYKPLVVAKSNKPLTEAESPHWARMKR